MTDDRRTRIKFCGLTREDDLDAAVAAGADAVGLVFCPRSPRHLELDQARQLAARVPAFVTLVALFLDPPADMVASVLDTVQPEMLQFHGTESASFCAGFRRRYIKAVGMGGSGDLEAQIKAHATASGYLLDSHSPGEIGGTGKTFNWDQMPATSPGLILAGGLDADNIGEAVTRFKPYAVDVSSGIESAPGIKSASKMADFTHAVRRADAARDRKS